MDPSEAGRQLDDALGHVPMSPPKPASIPVPPKEFPHSSLNYRVGRAPDIPIGPILSEKE